LRRLSALVVTLLFRVGAPAGAAASAAPMGASPTFGRPSRAFAIVALSAMTSVSALATAAQAAGAALPLPKDAVASLTSGSSGRVLLELEGSREVSLATRVEKLPSGPPIDCFEDVVLYQILFKPSPGTPANSRR
jgi:hypothetical protein